MDESISDRRKRAAHTALQVALRICPEAEYVVVAVQIKETELDMTTLSSVPPVKAQELLQYGIEDFDKQPIHAVQV